MGPGAFPARDARGCLRDTAPGGAPSPVNWELGLFGALASLSQQCSAQGRLVGLVPRLCFARATAPDFLPGLELELQEGHQLVKVASNRNQNLERFTPGAALGTTKTPHLNPKPSQRSARTSPLAAKPTPSPQTDPRGRFQAPPIFFYPSGDRNCGSRSPSTKPQQIPSRALEEEVIIPPRRSQPLARHPKDPDGEPPTLPPASSILLRAPERPRATHTEPSKRLASAQRRWLPTCSSQLLPPEAARASS